MKSLLLKFMPLIDLLLVPLIYPAAWLLKLIRRAGVQRLPRVKHALMRVGVFPIRNHYYEPQFDNRNPRLPFSQDRHLPGIDWSGPEQLALLRQFSFSKELEGIPLGKTDRIEFHFNNGTFESGDAEYWYQLIRTVKPKRIIEIGSGNSTLMAIKAIEKNALDDPSYRCEHVCIEPYEIPWLEQTGVSVIRKRVEEMDLSFFSCLQKNDILFIDSSHIIRPQGDVLFEYLELLPSLNKGVIVHIHDIFTPRNYPRQWLADEVCFWNEQYLLEAFLAENHRWRVLGALNWLHHHHYDNLKAAAPFLAQEREPGSFYIQRIS